MGFKRADSDCCEQNDQSQSQANRNRRANEVDIHRDDRNPPVSLCNVDQPPLVGLNELLVWVVNNRRDEEG